MTPPEKPEERLLPPKKDEHLLPVKPNERWDTLIGVIMAFAMAIGVWLYAIKPWQATYLRSTHVTEKASVPITVQTDPTLATLPERKHLATHAPQPTIVAAPAIILPPPANAAVASALSSGNSVAELPTVIPEAVAPVVEVAPEPELNAASAAPVPDRPVATNAPIPLTPPVTDAPIAAPAAVVEPVATPVPTVASIAEITAVPSQPVPTVTSTLVATPEPLPPNVVIRESIEFAMGQARVSESARPRLLEIAELLKKDTRQLKIVGHTDNIGFTGANRRLSLRRAKAVKAFLVGAGVNPDHLGVDSVGESQPIDDNGTEVGRSRNRRIEIVEQ